MTMFRSRAAALLAATAALALGATPALARDGGWGHPSRHHRGDGIGAGDVFAGLLVLGGIAAIASAASNSNRSSPPREPDYRYPDARGQGDGQGYGDARPEWRGGDGYRGSGTSIDGAVDACVAEVEQGNRAVDTIDEARRAGDGWSVEGRLRDGRAFSCSVDGDGEARDLAIN